MHPSDTGMHLGELEGEFCVGKAWGKLGHFPDFRLSNFPKIVGIVGYVGIERMYQMRVDCIDTSKCVGFARGRLMQL